MTWIASLNLCGLPASLQPLARRAAEFCRHFEESRHDVVNFQEVWGWRALRVLRAYLPSFPYVAWRPGPLGPAGGLATFSRQPFGTVSYASFRGSRPDRGGLPFRAGCAVNGMLQGVLTVEVAGTVLANTHLSANRDGDWSAANRYHAFQRAQVGMLHEVLRRTRATVVTGDFNIASDCALYPLIVDDGVWQDPYAATDPVTYHRDFLPPGATPHRIDYLLVRGHPVIDNAVLFAAPLALPDDRRIYLSDHVALSARIGLTDGRADPDRPR
jgi:hypothetical protein